MRPGAGRAALTTSRPATAGRRPPLAAQVPAGTATPFTRAAPPRRRGRALLQAANLTVLPPERAPFPAAGSAFMPVCPAAAPCDTAGVVAQYMPGGHAGVVHRECFPVQRITSTSASVVQGLADDTHYSVLLVTRDLAGHTAAWSALVRTQDLTPPVLSAQQAPAPGFTSFNVAVGLDEPGTAYAILAPAAAAAPQRAACPPPSLVGGTRGGRERDGVQRCPGRSGPAGTVQVRSGAGTQLAVCLRVHPPTPCMARHTHRADCPAPLPRTPPTAGRPAEGRGAARPRGGRRRGGRL